MSRALKTVRERIEYLKEDIRKSREAAAKWSMYEFDEDANPHYNDISADKYEIERLQELESQIIEDEKENDELKRVFEIIKNKQVNVRRAIILRENYQDYLENYGRLFAHCEQLLTEEEFNLLKRWLDGNNL